MTRAYYREKTPNGDVLRVHKPWSLDNFNDGYIDGDGRFRVYVPGHPRSSGEGYILRSIVAYEVYHGEVVTRDFAIHHRNQNRLDDSKENLQKLPFGEHSALHNVTDTFVERVCLRCGKHFEIREARLRDEHVGNYCSSRCYERRHYIPKEIRERNSLALREAQLGGKHLSILVTGSSGFLAQALIQRLVKEEHEVSNFDIITGLDIRKLGEVRKAIKGKHIVFHLGAVADLNVMREHPLNSLVVNIEGTQNIAVACMESGVRLYFASTCCIYGSQTIHPTTEESMPHPNELYAASKLAGEDIIRGLALTHGLEYNLMRFATIYGPGTRPALASHIFMGQALRGEPITVHGDGKQTRTLTYVDDLVEGMVALLNAGKLNEAWNLSTEEEVSAIQMAEDIKRLTKSESKIVFIPQRVGQTYRESISADKMRREVGWEAKTKWEVGLQKMFKWFVETRQIDNRYHMPEASKERV